MYPYIHAVQTLLWSENLDELKPTGRLVETVEEQWDQFREQAEALGFDAEEHRATAYNSAEGDAWDHAAHDWILTRNRHGCGFWDGDWDEPFASKLTALFKQAGPLEAFDCEEGFACLMY